MKVKNVSWICDRLFNFSGMSGILWKIRICIVNLIDIITAWYIGMLLLDYEFRLPHQYNEMLFVDPFLQPLILSIYYHCLVNFDQLLLFSHLTIKVRNSNI